MIIILILQNDISKIFLTLRRFLQIRSYKLIKKALDRGDRFYLGSFLEIGSMHAWRVFTTYPHYMVGEKG